MRTRAVLGLVKDSGKLNLRIVPMSSFFFIYFVSKKSQFKTVECVSNVQIFSFAYFKIINVHMFHTHTHQPIFLCFVVDPIQFIRGRVTGEPHMEFTNHVKTIFSPLHTMQQLHLTDFLFINGRKNLFTCKTKLQVSILVQNLTS